MRNHPINTWHFAPAILMLIISQFDWPYGYYQFLRVVVTITSGYAAYIFYRENEELWFVFFVITVLFNPLFPIHLERELWSVIDYVTAGIFIWLGFKVNKSHNKLNS